MKNENQPQFKHDLAQAATPEEIEGEKAEPTHDPAESLQQGLINLYIKYLDQIEGQLARGLIDSGKADELSAHILSLVKKDGLRNEIGYTSTERAQEIMGAVSYFGANEVMKAGIEIREEIPAIPFNPDELERGNELGQMLIYRTSTTMKELNDTFSPEPRTQNKGMVIRNIGWYKDEDFYASDQIQPGWALVSRRITPGSKKKNYLRQSEFLAEYLVNEVYKGNPLPREYQAAIDQLNDQKEMIQPWVYSTDEDEHLQASEMLTNLKINQLFHQTPAEIIYDGLVFFQNTGQRLHSRDCVWTNTQMPHGRIITVGNFGEDGAVVDLFGILNFESELGVSFSRRGADLKL